MNALIWLLIPVVATCFAAWWIAQRAQLAERDDPEALSETELSRMQHALEQPARRVSSSSDDQARQTR